MFSRSEKFFSGGSRSYLPACLLISEISEISLIMFRMFMNTFCKLNYWLCARQCFSMLLLLCRRRSWEHLVAVSGFKSELSTLSLKSVSMESYRNSKVRGGNLIFNLKRWNAVDKTNNHSNQRKYLKMVSRWNGGEAKVHTKAKPTRFAQRREEGKKKLYSIQIQILIVRLK